MCLYTHTHTYIYIYIYIYTCLVNFRMMQKVYRMLFNLLEDKMKSRSLDLPQVLGRARRVQRGAGPGFGPGPNPETFG